MLIHNEITIVAIEVGGALADGYDVRVQLSAQFSVSSDVVVQLKSEASYDNEDTWEDDVVIGGVIILTIPYGGIMSNSENIANPTGYTGRRFTIISITPERDVDFEYIAGEQVVVSSVTPSHGYEFKFANGGTEIEHTIQHDQTFADTIVSTKDGNPITFTVLSKPTWATVTINSNVVTVTSNNAGEYREGQIVYQQTETGNTIVSKIKQSAPPLPIFVMIGINSEIFYTNDGGQTWI